MLNIELGIEKKLCNKMFKLIRNTNRRHRPTDIDKQNYFFYTYYNCLRRKKVASPLSQITRCYAF